MEYTYSLSHVVDNLALRKGVYGFFANPSFGTTTLMMQLIDEFNKRKDGTSIVFSMELTKEQWLHRMRDLGISDERVQISDLRNVSPRQIEETINQIQNVCVLCIDYLEILGKTELTDIAALAEKYNIPVIVNGKLKRNSGDFDPKLRPELFSIGILEKGDNKISAFSFLALMHRNHKCDRGIGCAHRYDISNDTELIIKINHGGKLGSVFIEWDEEKLKFNL